MRIVSSGATHRPEESALAYDDAPNTRWTSGEAQSSTMAYWVMLDAPAMISGLRAVSVTWPDDNPRKWIVSIMDSEGGHGRKEVASGEGPIDVTWEPVRGQVVRIEQQGSDDDWWWSIETLEVKGEGIPPPPIEPPPDQPVIEVGPQTLLEPAARYLIEKVWAPKFGWRLTQRDEVDLADGSMGVELSVTYVTARARDQGILEPWPWDDTWKEK